MTKVWWSNLISPRGLCRSCRRYRRMNSHADSGSAANWSRSSTPWPWLAEDRRWRASQRAFPDNLLWHFDPWHLQSVVITLTNSNKTATGKTARTQAPSSSSTLEGEDSLERGWLFSLLLTLSEPPTLPILSLTRYGPQLRRAFIFISHLNGNKAEMLPEKSTSHQLLAFHSQGYGSDFEPIKIQDTLSWYSLPMWNFSSEEVGGQGQLHVLIKDTSAMWVLGNTQAATARMKDFPGKLCHLKWLCNSFFNRNSAVVEWRTCLGS